MRCGSNQMYGLPVLALGVLGLGCAPGAAWAQDFTNAPRPIVPHANYAVASPPSEPLESADSELTPEEQQALTNILNNAPAVSYDAPAKQLRTPALKPTKKLDMSRTD